MTETPLWMSHLGVTAMVAFVPFVLIVGTSFAKIAIVLGITRNALGVPGVPPPSVISALAVVMSIFIMAPVASNVADSIEKSLEEPTSSLPNKKNDDPYGIKEAKKLFKAAKVPMLDFLKRNTPKAEVMYFSDLAGNTDDGTKSLRIMLPAFASSELVEAILIGFLVLIPFFVIDLLVANVLVAMGMHMMSPAVAALPFKLLLFLAADGWHILLTGLMVSYGL